MNKDDKKIKLSILGSFGFMDIGDEAMLSEDLYFILNFLKIPRKNIFLYGGNPEYISYYHEHPQENCFDDSLLRDEYYRIQSSPRKRIMAKIKEIRKDLIQNILYTNKNKCNGSKVLMKQMALNALKISDAILITGGGTINTRDREGRSLTRMYTLLKYFHTLRKPVFISGQTIGPLGLYIEHDQMAREIIEFADVLTVRDSLYSRRYLSIINCKPKRFIETFDDAYTLPYETEGLPEDLITFINTRKSFAINITDYIADSPEQKKYIANLCEEIIKIYDVNIVLISHTLKDYYSLTIIRDMISNPLKERLKLPDTRFWRANKLKKLISSCRLAVGGRYHFIIFAGTSNTPFIGLCGNHYSYIKQDGFARTLGMENFILTEKETFDLPIVLSRINDALKTHLNISDKFKRTSLSMEIFGEWISALKGK